MRNFLIILFLIVSTACKKSEHVKPDSYNIRIEAEASNYYEFRVSTTNGIGKVYLNQRELTGKKSFTVTPDNNEAVTLYYSTGSPLWVKIYINEKKIIDQTQPSGSHLFYLTKP